MSAGYLRAEILESTPRARTPAILEVGQERNGGRRGWRLSERRPVTSELARSAPDADWLKPEKGRFDWLGEGTGGCDWLIV